MEISRGRREKQIQEKNVTLVLMLQASWTRKVVASKAVAKKRSITKKNLPPRAEGTYCLQTTQPKVHLFEAARARELSPKVSLPWLSGTENSFT